MISAGIAMRRSALLLGMIPDGPKGRQFIQPIF